MAFNKLMHPRNPFRTKPNFSELIIKYPQFRQFCSLSSNRKISVDFDNPQAVRELTQILLEEYFELQVDIPAGTLVPRVPQRLNYILWIEDILTANGISNDIVGIDIGTGASCIYPLLGNRLCQWRFYGTDIDEGSVRHAQQNVANNNLSEQIYIKHVSPFSTLKEAFEGNDALKSATFCMCNPPFFSMDESEERFVEQMSGSLVNKCRLEQPHCGPRSSTVATRNEVSTEGGEVQFVSKMIQESISLQKNIKLFTSMIGKKSSLEALKQQLSQIDGVHYSTSTFNQGRTKRWALAWTFCPNFVLPKGENAPAKPLPTNRKRRREQLGKSNPMEQ